MRDNQEKNLGLRNIHLQQSIKPLFTFIVIFLLIASIFIPSTIGKQEKINAYLIEFTSPSLIQQLSTSLKSFKDFSIIQSKMSDIANNISQFQLSAITQIDQIIDQKLTLNDLTQYQILFNGIRINNLSDSLVQRIEALSFVKQVEKDQIIYKTNALNDFATTPELPNLTNSLSLDKISISSYSGKNVSIAFFDTGIDYTHNGLSSSFIGGYDFVNDDEDPFDDNGHGTHVTGITVAQPTDGTNQIFGLAPNASVLSYKVLDDQGQGYTSWFLSAFERAMDPNQDGNLDDHVDIISISAGNPEGSPTDALSIAATQAVQAGIIVVAAAGNNGPTMNTISSPAIAEKVIAVGAAIDEQTIAPYSSRGSPHQLFIKPDVLAFGHQITSTWPDNQYETLSGTSMATPYITGVIACLLEHNPRLTPENMSAILHVHATPLSYNVTTEGYGLIAKSQLFNLKSAPISSMEISYLINGNDLNISFDINSNMNYLTYSASIQPLDQKSDGEIIYTSQENTSQRTIEFSTESLNTGYYVFQIDIIINDIIYRDKKIIFLEIDSFDIINIPQYIIEETSFDCFIQYTEDSKGLFIFIVPFRTIQCKIGLTVTFQAPRIIQAEKESITGVLFSILPGHSPMITKQSITIHAQAV